MRGSSKSSTELRWVMTTRLTVNSSDLLTCLSDSQTFSSFLLCHSAGQPFAVVEFTCLSDWWRTLEAFYKQIRQFKPWRTVSRNETAKVTRFKETIIVTVIATQTNSPRCSSLENEVSRTARVSACIHSWNYKRHVILSHSCHVMERHWVLRTNCIRNEFLLP
jgi:hypothetical protein